MAIDTNLFVNKLIEEGYTHLCVVPCSFAKDVINAVINNENIEYFYPIIAQQNCLSCHTKAKEGDILGIIDINYPVTDLKVSLTQMINFFIVFITIFVNI